jgi:hypothetical protein
MRAKRIVWLCVALAATAPVYAQENSAQLESEIQALKKKVSDLEDLKIRLDELEKRLATEKNGPASAKPASVPVKISGYLQTRFESNRARTPQTDFYLRRAYLKLQADPSPFASAVLQWDGAGTNVSPLDAYIDLKAKKGGSFLRIGQYKVPFGYEIPENPSDRLAPEASRALSVLFPGSRDRGVYASTSLKGHASFLLGALNGNGTARDNNNDKDYLAHAEIPLGSTGSIGFSGYTGKATTAKTTTDANGKTSTVTTNTDREYYGANLQTQIGRVQAHAEYALGRNLGAKINGGYVQLALTTPAKTTGGTPFLKYDWFDPSQSKAKDYFNRWTFGYAYDLDKSTRVTLTYEAAKDQATPTKDDITTLQFQVKY